jgi:curved DNA-binding protein CbpA
MNDNFALLHQPRRPWLDPEDVKDKFLALSAESHPDRAHGTSEKQKLESNERYAEINAAYQCLRAPTARLLHLLELELGVKPTGIQSVPAGTMELFVEVGQICRNVDSFLVEKAKVHSPLLQVPLFEQAMDWTDQLNALQKAIALRRTDLIEELKTMNDSWEAAPPPPSTARRETLPLERLEQIYRLLSFLDRWTEQFQERVVRLSF